MNNDATFQNGDDPSSPTNHGATSPPSQQQPQEETNKATARIRFVLLVFSALYTTFYGGAFFGWGPMQLLLEQDGAFHQKCSGSDESDDPDSTSVCSAQTAQLLNVQTVAQCLFIIAPLMGHVSDCYGPAVLMHLLGLSGISGIALLATSAWFRIDGLLYPAFLLISGMTLLTSMMTVQTGLLFEPVTRRRVISALNALLDTGALTYLVLWAVADQWNLTLKVVATGYLIPAVMCLGTSSLLWHMTQRQPWSKGETPKRLSIRRTSVRSTVPMNGEEKQEEKDGNDDVASRDETTTPANPPATTRLSIKSSASTNSDNKKNPDVTSSDIEHNLSSRAASGRNTAYVLIADRPPMEQLTSGQFVMLAIFFAFMTARNNFMLTTARDFLGYLGDDELDHVYLSIFTLLTPVSLAAVPFTDQALQRYGYHAGLQCINALALLHGIIQVSSTSLRVQVVGFVVFSFFRCFLFCVCFSFLPTFLSSHVMGKAVGVLQCVAGVGGFGNIPLAHLAATRLNGNFFGPNLFYTLLVLPNVYLVWRIGKLMQREGAAARGKSHEDKSNRSQGQE